MEVFESGKFGREGFVENIVGEVEETESGKGRELRRDWTAKQVDTDGYVLEETEVGKRRGKSSGKVEVSEVDGCHVMTGRIARDSGE